MHICSKTANTNFNIIAISETRTLKNTNIVKNINILTESRAESTAVVVLLYTADHLAYQKRNDLNILRIIM